MSEIPTIDGAEFTHDGATYRVRVGTCKWHSCAAGSPDNWWPTTNERVAMLDALDRFTLYNDVPGAADWLVK